MRKRFGRRCCGVLLREVWIRSPAKVGESCSSLANKASRFHSQQIEYPCRRATMLCRPDIRFHNAISKHRLIVSVVAVIHCMISAPWRTCDVVHVVFDRGCVSSGRRIAWWCQCMLCVVIARFASMDKSKPTICQTISLWIVSVQYICESLRPNLNSD